MSYITKVDEDRYTVPAWYAPWLKMVEGLIVPNRVFTPTYVADDILSNLIAAGWTPPNMPEEEREAKDDAPHRE